MSDSMVIIVSGHPELSEAHQSALAFIDNAYATKHTIRYVFFYADATLVANSALDTNSHNHFVKSAELSKAWEQLAKKHQFALIACISAALKRGVIDEDTLPDQKQLSSQKINLRDSFQLEGFSFLAESINHQQKIIEFCG